METSCRLGRASRPASLSAIKRFGAFKPEEEKRSLAPKIEETLATRRIMEGWKEYLSSDARLDDQYFIAEMITKGIFYYPLDVEAFSISLAGFQGERDFSVAAGFYLSALVNNCWGNEITIHTAHLERFVDNLGYQNTRDIIVKGRLGNCPGYNMLKGDIRVLGDVCHDLGNGAKGGTIHVEGNAMTNVGESLNGAAIIVEGDAGDRPGYNMGDGSIIIKGSCGVDVGNYMRKGRIEVFGEFGGISKRVFGGAIYHKGVLIAGKE